MNRDYYEQYREIELNHWWFQGRERLLKDLIRHWLPQMPAGRPVRILNVGCATGHTSEWLGEFGQVESIEYDEECAEMARQFTGLTIRQGSAEYLDYPDGSFDLVTAFDVLEHIPRDQAAAAELIRVCAPGGIVLVTVPAFQELWSEHDEINQHCRRYRLEGIAGLFDSGSAKGDVLKASYFNFWLFPAVALARFAQRVMASSGLRRNAAPTSDFQRNQGSWLSPLLRWILASESGLLTSTQATFPFGVSACVVWRADKSKDLAVGS